MAITPYNYDNPQKTPVSSGGSIKPFVYADSPVSVPVSELALKQAAQAKFDSSFLGQVKNTIFGLPEASGIPQAFSAGVQQMNQGSQQADTSGGNLIQRGEGVLNFGAGLASTVFSPAAPITNLIGKAIDYAGNKLADTPLIKNFVAAETPKQATTDDRVLQALSNLGGISMALLGAKAGEIKSTDIPQAKLQELAQHPSVIEAVKKVNDAQNLTKSTGGTEIGTTTIKPFDYSKPLAEQVSVAPKTAPTAEFVPKTQEVASSVSEAPKTPQQEGMAQDSIKYAKEQGAPVNPDGTITLYHGTDEARAPKEGDNLRIGTYFTTDKETALKFAKAGEGEKPIVMKIDVPAYKVFAGKNDGYWSLNEPTPLVTDFYNKVKGETPTVLEGTTPSGVAKSIEAKAFEAGLTKKFSHLADYDPSTVKEQANLFTDFINKKGIDEARAVLRGEKPLPEGQKGFPFIVNMETYLKEHPSSELAYELANSPHTSAASESASNLALGQNRVKDSFTAKAQEIRKARETRGKEVAQKRASVKKQAKNEMDKLNLSEADLGKLETFLDKITC